MHTLAASILVFFSGFAIMVLEIIGARLLAKDFGSSFYVWVSQIGVILAALAMGYSCGGVLGDRYPRASMLAWLLMPAGLITGLIPNFAPALLNAIILRHPAEEAIPLLWQKLDPALGSTLIFLLPCFVLATLPPFVIRLATRSVSHVGKISGLIYAASTVGSIVGVFVSGYVLIDYMSLSSIFRATGGLIVVVGLACLALGRQPGPSPEGAPNG